MQHFRDSTVSPTWLWGGVWLLIAFGALVASQPWDAANAGLLVGAGLLMIACHPSGRVPRSWLVLAALAAAGGLLVFLPAGWAGPSPWREELQRLGVETGNRIAIQPRSVAENLAFLVLTGGICLWLSGHRASGAQVKNWTLVFSLGVTIYAVLARWEQLDPAPGTNPDHFGFFPNRNHSATYLAMGMLCSLGGFMQAVRDKTWWRRAAHLAMLAVLCVADFAWSVSRAGIVLPCIGALIWFLTVGRQILGRHTAKAGALLGLAVVGGFLVAGSRVKDRLAGNLQSILEMASDTADASVPMTLDLRFAIWRDTLSMISSAPVWGAGAGQFSYFYPRFAYHTTFLNDVTSRHPESDWLWVAAEMGIPAALALAALVVLAAVHGIRRVRRGRQRSLRGACLAAALIVPIHGLFDVPGHLLPLALASAFLYALALSPREEAESATPRRLGVKFAGFLTLAGGGLLAWSAWGGGPPCAVVAGIKARQQAHQLYQQDQQRIEAARHAGLPLTDPAPEDDLLEKALVILDDAAKTLPLDREVRYRQGVIGLQFDDRDDMVDRVFALELALNPTSVGAPLRQAAAWSGIDPVRTETLWREAFRRLDWVEEIHPQETWTRHRTHERIRRAARGKPRLEVLARELIPGP